jgi:hypothetical protein
MKAIQGPTRRTGDGPGIRHSRVEILWTALGAAHLGADRPGPPDQYETASAKEAFRTAVNDSDDGNDGASEPCIPEQGASCKPSPSLPSSDIAVLRDMLMLSCGCLSRRQYQALGDNPLAKHPPRESLLSTTLPPQSDKYAGFADTEESVMVWKPGGRKR